MADKKISELDDGGVFQPTDAILIARDGDNFQIAGAQVPNAALVANTVERVDAVATAISDLADVAKTGSFNDLLDKPAAVDTSALQAEIDAVEAEVAGLATVARTGSYNDLADKPAATDTSALQAALDAVEAEVAALATVARTGSYNDLADKPAITDTTVLQAEINAIEAGAGLQSDGTYAANATANYLGDATSLKDADNRLDTALKQVADQVASLGSGGGGGSSSVATDAIPSARFWRVYFLTTVVQNSVNVQLSTLVPYAEGGTDLRTSVVGITASSHQDVIGRPVAALIDNDFESIWSSDGQANTVPQWVEFEFAEPVKITEFGFMARNAYAELFPGTGYFAAKQSADDLELVLARYEFNVADVPVFRTLARKPTLTDVLFPLGGQTGQLLAKASAAHGDVAWIDPGLADSGVFAGTYSNPTLTIDAKGRVTSALNGVSATSNYRGVWSLGVEYRTYSFDAQALPGQFSFDKPGASFAPLADNGHAYVLKFPPIPDATSTILTIPFTVEPGFDTVSVRYRTSSEFSDYSRGFIDNVLFFETGGETAFQTATRTGIAPGDHTLVISYTKDVGITKGDDTLYISEITIPSNATGKVYAYGDTVEHEGNTWFCVKAETVFEPGKSADWLPFLKDALTRPIPPTARMRGAWAPVTAFVQRTFTFDHKTLPGSWSLSQGAPGFVAEADAGRTVFRFPPTDTSATTTLSIPFNAGPGANTVTVRYATDSENSDRLIGKIDGTNFFEGSGPNTPYAEATTTVTSGRHTLTLAYAKDFSVNTGQDTAYISSVTIPAVPDEQAYHYGDLVSYAGKLWFCGIEGTLAAPGAVGNDWIELGGGSGTAPAPGGSGGPFPIQPPSAAQLTLTVGQTTTMTVGGTFTTFQRGDGVSNEQSGAFYGQDMPTTETWTLDAIIKLSVFNAGGLIVHGIALMASDGPLYVLGFDYGNPQITVTRLYSPSSYDTNVRSMNIFRTEYVTFRIAKTPSTYQFYFSQDFGNTWMLMHEIQITSFPNANRIGVHSQCYGIYTNNVMMVPYYNVTAVGAGPGDGSGNDGGTGGALTPYNYREGAGRSANLSDPVSLYLPTDRAISAIVMRLYRTDGVAFDDYPFEVAGKTLSDFFAWANTGTGGRVGGRVTFSILANGNVAVTITDTGGNLMWLEDGPNYSERFDSMFGAP